MGVYPSRPAVMLSVYDLQISSQKIPSFQSIARPPAHEESLRETVCSTNSQAVSWSSDGFSSTHWLLRSQYWDLGQLRSSSQGAPTRSTRQAESPPPAIAPTTPAKSTRFKTCPPP